MDQFTHMQHDNVWSSRQKAATIKIALEAILVVCRCDSIKKTAKENRFHIKLSSHIHDTTMRLDSDSLQTPLQFRGVQLITRPFTRG